MKLAIFTDIHYGERIENNGKKGVNTHGDSILPKVRQLQQTIEQEQPDLIINLGDTVTAFTKEKFLSFYKEVLSIFSNSKIPLYHLHGNHEFICMQEDELNQLVNQDEHVCFEKNNFTHLFVKAYKRDKEIIVEKNTIIWVKEQLQQAQYSVLVYCHYPLSQDLKNLTYYHQTRPQEAFVKQAQELRELFEASKKVKLVLSGHTHFFYQTTISGINYATIPSFSEDIQGTPACQYGIVVLPELKINLKKIK